MSDPFPAAQIAFIGEWTFSNVTAPPPTNLQLRLNNGGQNNATLMYANKVTFNGIDATTWLMDMTPGCSIKLVDKLDPTKWQSYNITGFPTAFASYIEVKIGFIAGGTNLAQTNILVSYINFTARPTGVEMAAIGSSAVASLPIRARVDAPAMQMNIGEVGIIGDVYLPGQAFPSDTPIGFSPGMTMRQYYAAAALTGFIAKGIAHNLIGTVSAYCWKVADSMVAEEARQQQQQEEAELPSTPVTPGLFRRDLRSR